MDTKKFEGIFPALLTPFEKDNSISHHTLRDLVRMNLEKGVSGFYVDGSTAETFLLTLDERKAILETVADEVAGRATLIVHIGCISQDQAIDLARHAKNNGADAMSSIPPFYYGFGWDEIKRYYQSLVDAVDLPMLVYNYPGNSGVKFTLENIRELLADPRFFGVKHTSSDYYMLERIKGIRPDTIIYNGFDEMFLSGIAMGASGGIGSTYNFMAEKFVRMLHLVRQGMLQQARLIQTQVNNILEVLFQIGIMPAEKAALELMGIPMGNCRKPFREITQEERTRLRNVLKENGCEV